MWNGAFAKGLVVALLACAAATIAEPAHVIYVDAAAAGANDGSSWQNACKFLQNALKAAAAAEKPVEIRVAQGVYKPDQGAGITPGDQAATIQLLNGVTLKGGYAGAAAHDPNARDIALYETILSGDLKGDGSDLRTASDNSCRVVTAASTDETVVIDGFSISGASGLGKCGNDYTGEAGIVIDGGNPEVRACHFVANFSSGLSVRHTGHPLLTGCVFDAGGGMMSQASSPILVDCVFADSGMSNNGSENASLAHCTFDRSILSGGNRSHLMVTDCIFRSSGDTAMWVGNCNFVLKGCLFEPAEGGGPAGIVVQSLGGDLTLEDCRFAGNKTTCIMGDNRTSLCLTRCSFVANTGADSGTVCSLGSLILCDCEFIGNSVPRDAGAVHAAYGLLKATNCVFAGQHQRSGDV
jgi:hypothetical protein